MIQEVELPDTLDAVTKVGTDKVLLSINKKLEGIEKANLINKEILPLYEESPGKIKLKRSYLARYTYGKGENELYVKEIVRTNLKIL